MGMDMRQLIPDEAVKASREAVPEVFEVWPEHWDAVDVFQHCNTQWMLVSRGLSGHMHVQGLDYTKVRQVREDLGIPQSRELFEQLQVMEAEGVRILNRM